jgi:hypothetical protein
MFISLLIKSLISFSLIETFSEIGLHSVQTFSIFSLKRFFNNEIFIVKLLCFLHKLDIISSSYIVYSTLFSFMFKFFAHSFLFFMRNVFLTLRIILFFIIEFCDGILTPNFFKFVCLVFSLILLSFNVQSTPYLVKHVCFCFSLLL